MAFLTAATERMRIDSSGNVGIGLTPAYRLDVGTTSVTGNIHTFGSITSGTLAGYSIRGVPRLTNDTGTLENTYIGCGATVGNIIFQQGNSFTAASNTERMRLDANGYLLIGTSTAPGASGKLTVSDSVAETKFTLNNTGTGGLQWWIGSTNNSSGAVGGGKLAFYDQTNGAVRMVINSSGQAIIGNTATVRSSESKLELRGPASTALSFYMFKDTQVEANIGFKASSDTNFYVGTTGTTVGNAGVYLTNGGNSWNAVSDERMKTIVEPIVNATAKVVTLRTVIGYYNNDVTQTRRPFLIAQDVQAVLPEAVNVQNPETGTLGMSYTDTIPLLVAAINELKAEFDAYKAAHP
jgi:hypothetical protein